MSDQGYQDQEGKREPQGPVPPRLPQQPGGAGGSQETQVLPQIDFTQVSPEAPSPPAGVPGIPQSIPPMPQTPSGPQSSPPYSPSEVVPSVPPAAQPPAAPAAPAPPAATPASSSSVPGTPIPESIGGYGPVQAGGYQPVMPGVGSAEARTSFGGLVGVDIRQERPMLSVRDLEVFYGAARVLKGISFDVYQGEIVTIIGGNGAGKSTTLKTISGVSELLKDVRGKIWYKGRRIDQLPAHRIARLGIAHVPEGRRVFPHSTVEDNLLLGAYRRFKKERRKVRAELDDIYDRFPVLAERRHRAAGLLSGGEQQMLAIARGLMANPDFLLLDEPSLGLAPILVREVFEIINDLAAEGKTILIVEQMAVQALEVADRAYVLETGSITLEGTGQELIEDPRVKAAYLGGA